MKYNNIQLIDLGLPSGNLWCDRNIGAFVAEQVGLYFAWGESRGFTVEEINSKVRLFNKTSYKAKYISSDLSSIQDAARSYLGDNFHIPTKYDFNELLLNCNTTWTDNYEETKVSGYIFTSIKNGKSVFFPTTGFSFGPSVIFSREYGYYWSASFSNANGVYFFVLDEVRVLVDSNCVRHFGLPIRAVFKR